MLVADSQRKDPPHSRGNSENRKTPSLLEAWGFKASEEFPSPLLGLASLKMAAVWP